MDLIALGDILIPIIAVLGTMLVPISIVAITQSNKNKERQRKHEIELFKMEQNKLSEMTELERIKQENYLLENADMRRELEQIRKENNLFNKEKQKDSRWLIEETKKEET